MIECDAYVVKTHAITATSFPLRITVPISAALFIAVSVPGLHPARLAQARLPVLTHKEGVPADGYTRPQSTQAVDECGIGVSYPHFGQRSAAGEKRGKALEQTVVAAINV
jgi:hypothetical protein